MITYEFRQYYLPPIANGAYQEYLCTIAQECEALSAEGWTLVSQLALQSGREVLFTFTRPTVIDGLEQEPPKNRGGRPRKSMSPQ